MRLWLKDIRNNKGLSQYQVAEQANISQSYYAGIEAGVRGNKLPAETAKKIARVLNFNWIRFYENNDEFTPTGTNS